MPKELVSRILQKVREYTSSPPQMHAKGVSLSHPEKNERLPL